MLKLEKDGRIVDSDLEIYAKHLKNLSEDFKVLFEDPQRMRVPDWIVTLFDFNVQNADINSQLQDELTDQGLRNVNFPGSLSKFPVGRKLKTIAPL